MTCLLLRLFRELHLSSWACRYDLALLQSHVVTSRLWLLVGGQLRVLVRAGACIASGCVSLMFRLELLLSESLTSSLGARR